MDELDDRIITALVADGRASFRAIGDSLSVSDQTVARRYGRLRESGQVRVIGVTHPAVLGETQWYVRARCTPNSAVRIAEALARREDTSWVDLISGGTEVVCSTRAHSSLETDQLLLRDFSHTPRVLDVTAQCELEVYTRGPLAFLAKRADAAGADNADLRAVAVPDPAVVLDQVDRALLKLLRQDGRLRTDELARSADVSAATVARRIAALKNNGALDVIVDVDPSALGLYVRTLAWFSVAPASLDLVARKVAALPVVGFAAATTGRTNLYASIFTRDVPSLHRVLTTDIAALPGVQSIETTLAIRRVKSF